MKIPPQYKISSISYLDAEGNVQFYSPSEEPMPELLHPLVSAIDPGRFRNRCAIEQNIGGGADELGHAKENWTAIALSPAWLEVEPLSGRELWRAQGIFPDATHVIRGYWISTLASSMRIVFGSRILHLLEPPRNVGERGIYFESLAREQVSEKATELK